MEMSAFFKQFGNPEIEAEKESKRKLEEDSSNRYFSDYEDDMKPTEYVFNNDLGDQVPKWINDIIESKLNGCSNRVVYHYSGFYPAPNLRSSFAPIGMGIDGSINPSIAKVKVSRNTNTGEIILQSSNLRKILAECIKNYCFKQAQRHLNTTDLHNMLIRKYESRESRYNASKQRSILMYNKWFERDKARMEEIKKQHDGLSLKDVVWIHMAGRPYDYKARVFIGNELVVLDDMFFSCGTLHMPAWVLSTLNVDSFVELMNKFYEQFRVFMGDDFHLEVKFVDFRTSDITTGYTFYSVGSDVLKDDYLSMNEYVGTGLELALDRYTNMVDSVKSHYDGCIEDQRNRVVETDNVVALN